MKSSCSFYKQFKVKVKVNYLNDVLVHKKDLNSFKRYWKKTYRNRLNQLSPTRRRQFDSFLKRLQKDQNDEKFCQKVQVRFINRVIGYGVFAKKDIPKYTILNHYAGLLRKDNNQTKNNDCVFAFNSINHFSIDGKKQGNWTRFMNHSEKPNVLVWEYFLPQGPRIIFTAGSKGIKKGRELTYCYGDDYWVDDDVIY